MSKLSNYQRSASADVPGAPPQQRRTLRKLLVCLVVVGLAAAGFYAYRTRMPKLPDIPLVNLTDADAEVAAAITAARIELQSSPRSAKAWGSFAMLLHGNGYHDAADVCYRAAETLDPENPDWPYLVGYLHHAGSGGPQKALPNYERAARLSPPDSMARVRMADMLFAQGELGRAEHEYQHILAFKSDEPHARLGLAKVAVARGRLKESLQHLLPVANDPFIHNRACAMMANVYQQLGNQALAEQARQRLAALPEDSIRPDDPMEQVIKREISVMAMISQAKALHRERRHRQMVAILREAVERYPQSDFGWEALATALTVTGDPRGAESAWRRSIELAPKTADYRLSLGTLLTGQKRYEEALQELRTAIGLNPRDGMAHLALGECLLEQGDEQAAAQSFEATLKYVPDQPTARKYLDQLRKDSALR